MAFLRTDQNKNTDQGDQLVSGAGGFAGEGTPVGGTQRSAAGQPGGWYNLQEFLQANQQTPNVQSRIQQRGEQGLASAKGQLQSNVKGLQDIPTAEKYSSDRLTSMRQGGLTGQETGQLRGFLDQSLAGIQPGTQQYELSAQEQLPDIQNPYQGLQPGSFESLMGWYGNLERPSANYTSGMQKMDEALLRGSKDFAKNFSGEMQGRFQQEVTDPLQEQRANLERRKQEASQQFTDEGKQWHEGISGFLGGEKAKVNERLAEQELELAKQNQMRTEDIMGDYYQDVLQNTDLTGMNQLTPGGQYVLKGGQTLPTPQADITGMNQLTPTQGIALKGVPGAGYVDYQRPSATPSEPYLGPIEIDPTQYISRGNVVAPTLGTAAQSYFSPQDLQTYNTLAGLVDQDIYDPQGLAQFDPGYWSFDAPAFEEDYRTRLGRMEEERLQPIIERILNTNYYPKYGQTAETLTIPEFLETKYGPVRLNLDQAGQTITQRPSDQLYL